MEEETEAIHEAGRSGADVVQPLRSFLPSLLIVCFALFITLALIVLPALCQFMPFDRLICQFALASFILIKSAESYLKRVEGVRL